MSGRTVVLLLLLIKPFVLLTVTLTVAVPPTVTGKVAAVVVSVKLSVVAVTVRLTVVEVWPELVGVMVIVVGPEAAMLAAVEIVTTVDALFVPSKLTC